MEIRTYLAMKVRYVLLEEFRLLQEEEPLDEPRHQHRLDWEVVAQMPRLFR
jgi:hypothetical protein